MSLKSGMSWKDLQELEKGAVKDAVTGVAMVATLAAAGTAQNQSKEMMKPNSLLSHVQMHDDGGATQEIADPTRARIAESEKKVGTFKQRLAEVREQMKAGHKPNAIPVAQTAKE